MMPAMGLTLPMRQCVMLGSFKCASSNTLSVHHSFCLRVVNIEFQSYAGWIGQPLTAGLLVCNCNWLVLAPYCRETRFACACDLCVVERMPFTVSIMRPPAVIALTLTFVL